MIGGKKKSILDLNVVHNNFKFVFLCTCAWLPVSFYFKIVTWRFSGYYTTQINIIIIIITSRLIHFITVYYENSIKNHSHVLTYVTQ